MSGEKRTPGDHQLSSIQIPDELKAHYKVLTGVGETEERVLNLKGLSRVNLFVGPNNSGKSRFLRGVAAASGLRFRPRDVTEEIEKARAYLVEEHIKLMKQGSFREVEPFGERLKKIPQYDEIKEGEPVYSPVSELVSLLKASTGNNIALRDSNGSNHLYPDNYVSRLQEIGRKAESLMNQGEGTRSDTIKLKRLYIPTLRGMRPVGGNRSDLYRDRVRKDYFENELKGFGGDIYTGLSLYDEVQRLLLGDREQRKSVREYEDFLANHLFGKKVELIPRTGLSGKLEIDVVFVKIGNEKERPIYELGDGVQSVIILTFPLFLHRTTPMLVFIEEPELFLHPGMQRTLMKAMLNYDGHSYFGDHQYFISTHSNHLLDLAMEPEFDDVSIFKLRKATRVEAEDVTATFTVELAVAHDHQMLEMLGVRVSSVFLTNCTIWVEGITDRLYFARFLKLYCDHLEKETEEQKAARPFRPRQDYHYSFVEYSGGNITHWSFLDDDEHAMQANRLCAHMMLIADRDSGKDERHERLAHNLGERFCRLECQEVENLLTPEVIKAVVRSYEGSDYQDVDFTQSAYKLKGLGTFIEETWTGLKRRGGYAEKGGSKGTRARKYKTIKDKPAFCERALKAMTDYNSLSEEAKELAKRMYQFILDHNKEGKRA